MRFAVSYIAFVLLKPFATNAGAKCSRKIEYNCCEFI